MCMQIPVTCIWNTENRGNYKSEIFKISFNLRNLFETRRMLKTICKGTGTNAVIVQKLLKHVQNLERYFRTAHM